MDPLPVFQPRWRFPCLVSLPLLVDAHSLPQGDLFGYILDLTGGITGSLTSFVIPAITFLKATEGNNSSKDIYAYRRWAYFLCIFGSALIFLVPTAVFMSAAGMG